MTSNSIRRERIRGAMLGLACGDALGVPLEFQQPGTFPLVTEYLGGGPWGLRPGEWTVRAGELHPEVADVAAGSYRAKAPPEIRGRGYVVATLEAALWALHRHGGFRDGAIAAVNLAEDADTTGAVYGQLAGALYGEAAIPESWRAGLARAELVGALADRLAELGHLTASEV